MGLYSSTLQIVAVLDVNLYGCVYGLELSVSRKNGLHKDAQNASLSQRLRISRRLSES